MYCASSHVSLALRAERFGHKVHGHDVEVTVCVISNNIINIDELNRVVRDVAEIYDHRPLWEVIPGDPILEDLACRIISQVSSLINVEPARINVEMRIPGSKIIVFGSEGLCGREAGNREDQ